ncbi:MAG: ATP-dependent RNA helicase RhlB [Gammaproteobacteria bacterium]
MENNHLSEVSFSEFELPASLLKGVQEAGFSYCTPIQAETIPLALKGKDIAGQAQTGTGKTAAFLVALYAHLLNHPLSDDRRPSQVRALVLAPTRELAIQIHRDAEKLGLYTGLKLGLAYGGTDYDKQRKCLVDGVDILIGTPGRIIDYFKQRVFDLRKAQVIVLDEADRMFDLGFINDVRFLLHRCPPPEKRLGLLFSATLSLRVNELAYEHMNNPEIVKIEAEQVTADRVRQQVFHTANEEKIPLLVGLMKKLQPSRAIVFVNTKHVADRVWGFLEGNGLKAAILSGDVPQKKRQSLLQRFQEGELPVLVATDVAARGLHVPDVTHVFNFDLPQDAEDYVHRIGRTARIGADGDAISFACEQYVYSLPDIEEFIGHSIPLTPITDDLLTELKPRVRTKSRPVMRKKTGRSGPHKNSGRSSNNRNRRQSN